jgi:glycosyltransferase involved in cell wall biosynthesis
LVVYRRTQPVDAIDEYSRRLVDAMVRSGRRATYLPDGLSIARRTDVRPDWILLQYMPFSYARWGLAPGVIRDAIALKRATGARFAVMVHECWVPMVTWRTCLMGAYQRAQLRTLLRVADVFAVSMESFLTPFGSRGVAIPVGSNISPTATARDDARQALGVGDELVIALFGTGNAQRVLGHAETALAALVDERGTDEIRVLNLGAGAKPLSVPPGLRVDTPGTLAEDEVSLRLRASDLLLLSFADGISTRRGTLMAGLAHGLPIVGLRGVSTDAVLLRHPEAFVLTPVGDHEAFAKAVLALAGDRERMAATGQAAGALYREQFDWPVIADRMLALLEGARPAP